jgi:hypothetical protein
LTYKFFKSRHFLRHNSTFFEEGLVAWIAVFLDDDDDDDDDDKVHPFTGTEALYRPYGP